jgi:ABC-2 type transport system ATP-binding protein
VLVSGRVVACGDVGTFGGRASGEATVSWLDGDRRCDERTADPAAAVAVLSQRYGGPVPGLTVTRPTLEDVYLNLIGGAQ